MMRVPGDSSKQWLARLKAAESPNVTYVAPDFPVVWASARGVEVTDVDGHTYLDAGSSFGVALVGHCHPRVVEAACAQTRTLIHGMGDVHPPQRRIELLERLQVIAPASVGAGVLCTGGAEAVEVALKTAQLVTGRSGALSFRGGYHGLSLGALSVTARSAFRSPFVGQVGAVTQFTDFPGSAQMLEPALDEVQRLLRAAKPAIGVVMVEPIQGRGGTVVPPEGFLRGLRALCDAHGVLLCLDEIFTGIGRTGTWFACEHESIVPDLLCVGKALGGGFPLSACLGGPGVMAAWGPSTGEALHTSTFLGHPVACAASLATLAVIEEEELMIRAARAGQRLKTNLAAALGACDESVVEVRGRGLMLGVQARSTAGRPGRDVVMAVVQGCLQRGVIILPAGDSGDVLQLTPPAICTDDQLDRIVEVIAAAWKAAVA